MPKKSRNKVRIISGRMRGRLVSFPDQPGLRPTGDRLRETLFSWLLGRLPGSRCLDMFAGSGVLGFEAVSRGASKVVMIETSKQAYSELCKNVELLQLDNVVVECGDAISVVSSGLKSSADAMDDRFDVVFVDPPFAQQLHQTAIDALSAANVLADNAVVCVESAKRDKAISVPDHWILDREKVAGEVRLCLYRIDTKIRSDLSH